LLWLRIRTGGGHLWMWYWSFGFNKIWGISWPVSFWGRTLHHGVSWVNEIEIDGLHKAKKFPVKECDFWVTWERTLILTREKQDCVNRYRVIYRRVIQEAERRENERYFYVSSAKIKLEQFGKY
jgi:hypothetical protein